MLYVWATILTLVNAGWLLLTIIGLPGTWLMLLCTGLVAWWHWDAGASVYDQMFGLPVLIAAAALATLGEIFEFFAGVFGSSVAGGSRRSAGGALVGTFVGGLVGTFFLPIPIVGALIGACAGAAIGAWGVEIYDGRPLGVSVQSGVGAGVGRFLGTVAKLACGVAMWILLAIAAFWP